MRLLVSWLRDFVDVTASPREMAGRLELCGFEVASIEAHGGQDAVIDLEVTANRPDCLSVIGLAREVATAYDLPLALPSAEPGARIALNPAPVGESSRVTVTVEDDELCPRYAAVVAEVRNDRSPSWIAERLDAVGIRPISAIVDLTNYVLIELGHPTHAFDLARLGGPEIRVRRARAGEMVTTLDGIERRLDPDMLVIADRDRAQAVAGVMGARASEVSSATRTVVFESACFKPASVRRTSKRLGLKTEASARFERGADINAPLLALARIVALMEQAGIGQPLGPLVDRYPSPRQPLPLHLRRQRLAQLLGAPVDDAVVERVLSRLGLMPAASADGWDVVAPTCRVDLLREVDLIEEVGRHYGFDRIEPTFPVVPAPVPPPDVRVPRDRLLRRILTAAGLSEAVTFSFLETDAAQAFVAAAEGDGLVAIANPLSAKFEALRSSLLPGLVDAVAHNRRHGRRDVGLFEIGARFTAGGETRGVAVAWTGAAAPEHWSGGSREVDFFDVKGVVERLSGALDVPLRFEAVRKPFLTPGRAASVLVAEGPLKGAVAGVLGQVVPAVLDARGLPRQDAVLVAELDLDRVWQARGPGAPDVLDDAVATRPLPRHPFVVRDLSIVVADALPAEVIRGTIQAAGRGGPAPLVAISVFDRYHGKGVPDGRVSLSVRLTFQAPDRTLTDADVQESVDAIVATVVREHGAVQR